MIEYLYNAVIATAGENITITARIEDDNGITINNTHLSLFDNDDNKILTVNGVTVDGLTNFTISADDTANIRGRYWYCICGHDNTSYCFKQPIYLK